MSDMMSMPGHKSRLQTAGACAATSFCAPARAVAAERAVPLANPTWCFELGQPWPAKAGDISPLAWWRTLPREAFGEPERLLLVGALKCIHALRGGENMTAALNGDPASAIAAAYAIMLSKKITLVADVVMTALLRCALEHDPAAALVMAQVTGRLALGHSLAPPLAASWSGHRPRQSVSRRALRTAEASIVAGSQGRERQGAGA